MKQRVDRDVGILEYLEKWFHSYVRSFYSSDPEFQYNIILKEKHTLRVVREIKDIAGSLHINSSQLFLAEVSALFHDIGRFEQYKRYRTFSDFRSEDHALLGVKILKREKILSELDVEKKDLIFRIISYHNKAEVPRSESRECTLLSELLRDADKLDIWNVVIHHYVDKKGADNNALIHGLPDVPGGSLPCLERIFTGQYVRFEDLKTLNDFKLMQMSWIFDVKFPRTFQRIKERHYLEKLKSVLNQVPEAEKVYAAVNEYLEGKLQV